MECIKCGHSLAVVDSRKRVLKSFRSLGSAVYRRRVCEACGSKFTTYEVSEAVLKSLMQQALELQLLRGALSPGGTALAKGKFRSTAKAIEYLTEKE